jgi:branched-chain amino acid transport system substrate-binding protein
MEGAAYYYYDIPKNPVNDWLAVENKKRFSGAPPDFFTCGGFIAAQAVVEALKKTGGSTDAEKLIAAMEGMSFESPKGKVMFRNEDHQLMQPMYAFKIKVDPKVLWAIPELTRVISSDEMKVPITNHRQ